MCWFLILSFLNCNFSNISLNSNFYRNQLHTCHTGTKHNIVYRTGKSVLIYRWPTSLANCLPSSISCCGSMHILNFLYRPHRKVDSFLYQSTNDSLFTHMSLVCTFFHICFRYNDLILSGLPCSHGVRKKNKVLLRA